ncbi:MAG: prolyl oligopeptidase family serine peptidase [Alphaproteobacteria bacterium]|nr:prolyl oligopeptidase family serine peptidase [Alphaproteobacteria bacterium]
MKNIKIKAVLVSWFILGGMEIHAEPSANSFYQDESYKELLNTKDIIALELSPDNHHVLLTYATPQVYDSKEGILSQWQLVTLVKNDYKSAKSHTVTFPEDKGIDLATWIPNSQNISYLGQGDKYVSLWVTPHQEFKPKKIIELNHDIKNYWWSPDGKKLAILVHDPLPSRDLTVYGEDESVAATLYIMEANEKGDFIEKGSFPLKFEEKLYLSWVPSNEKVVLGYKAQTDAIFPVSQIILLDLKTKEQKALVQGEQMNVNVVPSPDGKWLAYVTTSFPGNAQNPIPLYQMDASRVCLISLQDNQKRCLAPTPNENSELVGWKHDGKSIFVVDQEGISDQIYELGLEGEKTTKLTQGEQSFQTVQLNSAGDAIVYSSQNLQMPVEGYVTPVDRFLPEKITSLSKPNLPSHLSIEKVKWKSKDKKFDLEGLVIYPSSTQEKTLFPLMILLKNYSSQSTLDYLGKLGSIPLSPLRLLKKGYALFIPTRRGENGYGVQFRQALYKELGKGDFEDIMGGIEAVIEEKKVDPTNLALWGWGYGGYLSAWTLTQTARFKTIIVGQGIANLISQVGTTTKPEFLEAVMGGPFWKDFKLWDERSPISYVKNMNTPTFLQYVDPGEVIHKSQGEELYFPLSTRGIATTISTVTPAEKPLKLSEILISEEEPERIPMFDSKASFASSPRATEICRYLEDGDNVNDPHLVLLSIQDLETWLEEYFKIDSNVKTEK